MRTETAAGEAATGKVLDFAAAAQGGEQSLWADLASASDAKSFARAWLPITARSFPAIRQAAILLEPEAGAELAPLARWAGAGAEDQTERFTERSRRSFEAAMREKRPVLDRSDTEHSYASHPFLIDGDLRGAVLVEAKLADQAMGPRLLRHLEWSSAWVEAFVRRGESGSASRLAERAAALGDIVNAVLAAPGYRAGAQALVEFVAQRLHCARAALGRRRGLASEIVAHAQTAGTEQRGELTRAMALAMDEALDQEAILVAPADGRQAFVAYAQETLRSAAHAGGALTIPLLDRGEPFGALTLLRDDRPFSADDIDFADALIAAAAPVLVEKYRTDRGLVALISSSVRRSVRRLIGPDHLTLKIAAAILTVTVLASWLVKMPYSVVAHGQVQGEVRRVMGAPFDGYIKAQHTRAGEIVRSGDLLAELQDNDLSLQRLRQIAQRQQYQLEHDRALAKRDLAQINIARAQVEQASAEIDLSEQMLARTQVRAPFDAVVVSGDLSSSIGKPVSRGDTLFELAPLDRYRVTLVVPEADIGSIRQGSTGRLLLTALPEEALPIEVVTVTPVAKVVDGINGFEVLASLRLGDQRIRPSMEGIAKIDAGEARLVWIWTHGLMHWARVKIWPWLP